MDPSFWHDRWRRSEIGFHKPDINPLLTDHWAALAVVPGQTVFVPLCGKSLDMLWLARQGYAVLGIELSEVACRAFFTENGLVPAVSQEASFTRWSSSGIEILQGDFFDLRPEHVSGVAAVYDRAALVALPPDTRARYAQHLASVLAAPIPILLLTMEYEQSKRPGPPFSVPEDEVRQLYAHTHAVTRLSVRDAFSPQSPWAQMGLTWLHEKVFCLQPLQ